MKLRAADKRPAFTTRNKGHDLHPAGHRINGEWKAMTNADKIRSMDDQELGSFLCDLMKNGCKMCPSQKQEYCEDDIMLWMQEEYGENGYGDYKYLTGNEIET